MRMKAWSLIFAIFAMAIFSVSVAADPTGPTLINGTPERGTIGIDGSTGTVVEAQAGNMTALFINTTTLTKRWQGYYGNVTGTITLDDGAANSMYSWAVANAEGEIFAVNGSATPTWADVECFNFSSTSQSTTLTDLETNLGMSSTDDDSVTNTFNLTYSGSFTVGDSNTIDGSDGNNCSMVSLYVDDDYNELNFNETILLDDAQNLIIYTTFLEQDETGFQGSALDFQMIVGENGDSVASTPYYFYVELS